MEIKDLLTEEKLQLKHMDDLVTQVIEDENIITRKIIEGESDEAASFGQKLSDRMADVGGSWGFIIGFLVFIALWVAFNIFSSREQAADPYPFIFLNLLLSCLAAFQAPVIMMSQNRQEEKDRRRARSDYMINLKAEMEIRALHDKLDAFEKTHNELLERLIKNQK